MPPNPQYQASQTQPPIDPAQIAPPQPKSYRNKIIIAVVILVIAIVLAIVGASIKPKPKAAVNNPAPSKSTAPTNTTGVQTGALAVATKYIQAREDSVGADQAGPFAWVTSVKSITTPAWYAKLQPIANNSTSNVSNNYYTAHSNNYVVKADATECSWDDEIQKHTTTSGVISCALSDTTVDKTSGQPIASSLIPFGWIYNGAQISPVIWMTNQNGVWLVNDDTSGQGQ